MSQIKTLLAPQSVGYTATVVIPKGFTYELFFNNKPSCIDHIDSALLSGEFEKMLTLEETEVTLVFDKLIGIPFLPSKLEDAVIKISENITKSYPEQYRIKSILSLPATYWLFKNNFDPVIKNLKGKIITLPILNKVNGEDSILQYMPKKDGKFDLLFQPLQFRMLNGNYIPKVSIKQAWKEAV